MSERSTDNKANKPRDDRGFAVVLGLREGDLRALLRAVRALHRWYEREARPMPWRQSADPYAIWVSEVMLQQTQVATVIPYFERWLEAFPTVTALAEADEQTVLLRWEGLGYYRRARMLHRAARIVAEELGGEVPADPARFAALPGVGSYTTAAVMSLAFGVELATVDGNVYRVLSRLVALEHDPRRAPFARALGELAGRLLRGRRPALHNQALMELGALVCTPRRPACAACPFASVCRARAGDPERYPVKRARKAVPHEHHVVALLLDGAPLGGGDPLRGGGGRRLLLERRPPGRLLGGLWDLPSAPIEAGEPEPASLLAAALRRRYGCRAAVGERLPSLDHVFSHLKVTLHPFVCHVTRPSSRAGEKQRETAWVTPEQPGRPMPRAAQRILARWLGASSR